MIRLALFNMKDHTTGEKREDQEQEPLFDFWEVMLLTMACLNQDEMNQLELDNEFMKRLIEMPVYGTKENERF